MIREVRSVILQMQGERCGVDAAYSHRVCLAGDMRWLGRRGWVGVAG